MAGRRRAAIACLAAGTLMLVLGIAVVWRLADGPDSDWLVGLITASPSLLLAALLLIAGLRVRRSGG